MQCVELEDPPALYKSAVWEKFGFPVQYSNDGKRVVDRTKTVCWRCSAEVGYVAGNTSNMLTHMRRHHPDVSVTGARKKTSTVQQLIPGAFNQTLSNKTDRAKKITEAIGHLFYFVFYIFLTFITGDGENFAVSCGLLKINEKKTF